MNTCLGRMGSDELSFLILLGTNFMACLWKASQFVILILKSLTDSLTELNVLTGEWQRGESWALENVLNPTSGSQGQTVNSSYVQISLKTSCIRVTSSGGVVLICIYMNLLFMSHKHKHTQKSDNVLTVGTQRKALLINYNFNDFIKHMFINVLQLSRPHVTRWVIWYNLALGRLWDFFVKSFMIYSIYI